MCSLIISRNLFDFLKSCVPEAVLIGFRLGRWPLDRPHSRWGRWRLLEHRNERVVGLLYALWDVTTVGDTAAELYFTCPYTRVRAPLCNPWPVGGAFKTLNSPRRRQCDGARAIWRRLGSHRNAYNTTTFELVEPFMLSNADVVRRPRAPPHSSARGRCTPPSQMCNPFSVRMVECIPRSHSRWNTR
jgi:hypothetical protein